MWLVAVGRGERRYGGRVTGPAADTVPPASRALPCRQHTRPAPRQASTKHQHKEGPSARASAASSGSSGLAGEARCLETAVSGFQRQQRPRWRSAGRLSTGRCWCPHIAQHGLSTGAETIWLLRCLHCANRRSPVDRMAPSPLDITSAATHPIDCRTSEVYCASIKKHVVGSGNTAIRRQNVKNVIN
jgi:hypothetical protein